MAPDSGPPSWESLVALVHFEDVDIVRQHSRTALTGGGRCAEIELTSDGRPLKIIGAIEDSTSYRKLEDQLMLVQRLESVVCLAGGAAHDFNNMLTVILGCSELLMDPAQQREESRHYAMEIRRAAS